jgi:hypothetical protein
VIASNIGGLTHSWLLCVPGVVDRAFVAPGDPLETALSVKLHVWDADCFFASIGDDGPIVPPTSPSKECIILAIHQRWIPIEEVSSMQHTHQQHQAPQRAHTLRANVNGYLFCM